METKALKPIVGWFRALEVTHDPQELITPWMYYGTKRQQSTPKGRTAIKKRQQYYKCRGLTVGDKNPHYDTYNPHFHVLLAANPSYFTSKDYISQAEFTALWRRSMRLDYDPVVYVERVKGNTGRAVAELSKYAVKDADYIVPDDWDLTVDAVRTLDSALANRRLIAYGGKMRELHKKLNLQDEGAEVHIDGEKKDSENKDTIVWYGWNVGFSQYFKCSE
jgi:plasmid rolling circle replication initiator protein Rep